MTTLPGVRVRACACARATPLDCHPHREQLEQLGMPRAACQLCHVPPRPVAGAGVRAPREEALGDVRMAARCSQRERRAPGLVPRLQHAVRARRAAPRLPRRLSASR